MTNKTMKNTPVLGLAFALCMPAISALAQDEGDYLAQTPEDCQYVNADDGKTALPYAEYSIEMLGIHTGCLLALRDQGRVETSIYREAIRAFQTLIFQTALSFPTLTLKDNYTDPDGIIGENFVHDYAQVAFVKQYLGAFYKDEDFYYDPDTVESDYLRRFGQQLQAMNAPVFNGMQTYTYEEEFYHEGELEQHLHPNWTPATHTLTA